MGYDFLLFDADQTLFDFDRSEYCSLRRLLTENHIAFTDELYADYHAINHALWKALERGEITREMLIRKRFDLLSANWHFTCEPDAYNARYLELLGQCSYLIDGAAALCRHLSVNKKLYLITNGVAATQRSRYEGSALNGYFLDVFVSEAIGANKPSPVFFAYVFAHIPDFDASRALVIGDSLTSDMRGANNAGIDCCWYNPGHVINHENVVVNFEIASLDELTKIVDNPRTERMPHEN